MEGQRQRERIQAELLKQALKLAPVGVFATFLNSLILVLVLWQPVSHTKLLTWFSITLCLVIQRGLFLYKHRRVSLLHGEAARATKEFVVGIGLAGMAWGSLPIFLFPLESPTHQTLIVFVLCGMVAGAAETFAPVLPAFIVFAVSALVPLFIRFLTIGGTVYYAMSAMTLIYLVLTFVIAKRVNITNRKLIELKEHYSRTAEELAASNKRLQERTDELSVSNKALEGYTERLERLNEELQDFAFVASHDLQEPLRKIQTFCNMIQEKYSSRIDSSGQEYLGRIISSASRMRQLVSDLLQLSRLTSIPKEFEIVDLAKIAREAADVFKNTVEQAGGSIEVGTLPALEADESQILRLFQNLIGNAIKFHGTEPPKIVIYAKLDENGICEIFIDDNGIGFDPQFAERIFKPFQRLHKLGEYEGTGMGLTICRKIAEFHGGSISARSEPGKGSTFIVRLPLKQTGLEGR